MYAPARMNTCECVCVRGREATARFALNLCCGWGGITTERSHPSSAHLPLYVVFLFAQRWDGSLCRCLAAGEAARQYLITQPCGCICTPYTSLNTRTRWGFDNYGVDNLLLSFLSEELRLRCVAGQINKELAEAFAVKSSRCFKTKGIMAVCVCRWNVT